MSEQAVDSNEIRNARARQAGLAAVASLSTDPTGLIKYQSRGRVALIGDANAIEIAERLNENLQPQVLLLGDAGETNAQVLDVADREVHIGGYLGAFRISLGEEGAADTETVAVDLSWT